MTGQSLCRGIHSRQSTIVAYAASLPVALINRCIHGTYGRRAPVRLARRALAARSACQVARGLQRGLYILDPCAAAIEPDETDILQRHVGLQLKLVVQITGSIR